MTFPRISCVRCEPLKQRIGYINYPLQYISFRYSVRYDKSLLDESFYFPDANIEPQYTHKLQCVREKGALTLGEFVTIRFVPQKPSNERAVLWHVIILVHRPGNNVPGPTVEVHLRVPSSQNLIQKKDKLIIANLYDN